MYTPKSFQMADPKTVIRFIRDHSFGILFSQLEGEPMGSHLPFGILCEDCEPRSLYGHMAKANPQWRGLSGQSVLVVFSGPHSFVASDWYEERGMVPTWNYTAVHVQGRFMVIDNQDELKRILRDSLSEYEPGSRLLGSLEEDAYRHLMTAIVGFKIEITAVHAKWKLSQNHSEERQRKVIRGLRNTGNHGAKQIADLMTGRLDSSVD